MVFRFATTVQLHDTDAAGLLFFGHQFKFAHDAYQAYLAECGLGLGGILATGDYLIPIVHAAADYLKPLAIDQELTIELTATKVSTHSFALEYRFLDVGNELVGQVSTVHVTIDQTSRQKIPLPVELRQAMEKIYLARD